MTPVFRDYDQERLDALLDVRRRVPDFATFTDRFERRSAAVRARRDCHLDVRYGAQPRERLDLFLPHATGRPVPANVFFHGGYWRSSEKERYSFLADGFLPAGAAYVAVEYTLIPDVDIDELIRQCRAALAWLHRNAGAFGIDRQRLFISGHSAGGQIVGMLAAAGWQDAFAAPVDIVKGVCAISGLYDLEPIRCSYLNATLGLDEATAARNSPALLAPATPAPFITAVGGDEGEEFLRQNTLVGDAWGDTVAVTSLVLAAHNHYTAVEALSEPTSTLGRAVLTQMQLVR
jgi:arylformamidase